MKTLATIFLLTISVTANAESYVPKPDFLVAKTTVRHNEDLSIIELERLVLRSQSVGKTEVSQGFLKTELAKRYQANPTAKVGYLYARVLQREHLFSDALTVINTILKSDPNLINPLLLKANMLQTKGKFEAAKLACLKLLGRASVETVSTCALDAESHNGKLETSYKNLQSIVAHKPTSQATQHVLAEMAFRLNQPKQTLKHLANVDLNEAPVSILVLWSDAQLALSNYTAVIDTISNLVSEPNNLEDALLLRLAQAEKQDIQSQTPKWQALISERIELRERRQDTFHAADLALYYLTIDINSDKALYWATINWQQAKLESDKILLAKAKARFKELENE
ncbi:tetratricopeptide repeat protein [Psychrosphaera aestuarii]|uniref:tetratricopeptide repeat protein n=1 Tax=Psychrosphaera aestuarii TaxID=1266052 RepID=UPI001B337556|nr:hypothetical protein [Psychrosphaera aestuarii]